MGLRKIFIFCPFWEDFEPKGGSMIRVKGYTTSFEIHGLNYAFVSAVKPDYVPGDKYYSFEIRRYFKKIIVLHNILYSYLALRFFSIILRYFIISLPAIKGLRNQISDSIMITHKDNSIGYFFYLMGHKRIIYDIHGILDIQREYLSEMKLSDRFWFKVGIIHEKMVFRNIRFLNCINENMYDFLKQNYGFKGQGFLAPDGISNTFFKIDNGVTITRESVLGNNKKKVILFFGSFKKIGGVHLLAEAFCRLSHENPDYHLITIGNGQMELHVKELIRKNGLSEKYTSISQVTYNDIFRYIDICDVIVIPDISNEYNRLIPHIKLYDALITGKPFVLPAFDVNRLVIEKVPNNAIFFQPDDINDLAFSIKKALNFNQKKDIINNDISFNDLKYTEHARNLIHQYESTALFLS